jgi:hypothetical protein
MSNSEFEENPREVIGANNPPLARSIAAEENFAATVTAFLDEEYRELQRTVPELLDEARALPAAIEDDAVMGDYAKLIKRLRDTAARAEAFRVKEGEPYLRGKQAVDSFFASLREKCARNDRKAKPGAADILQARLDDYNQRKLAAEQERRRVEAERLRKEAEDRQRAEAEAARKAEEDRLAAERARKPETVVAKEAVADRSEQVAAEAKTEAALATGKAEEAHIATLAKPADLVRTRIDQGPTVTMATEPYAVVEDYDALDLVKLRPFISHEALDKALRSWARTTGFSQEMPGAKVGRRPKTVVR